MVKSRYILAQTVLIILFLSLVSGCTYPIMISHGGQEHVAPVLGVEEDDIKFVQYGYYHEDPRSERVPGKEGIIVLTDETLVLIEGLLSTMDGTPDVVLPVSELDGVYMGNYQLQVKRGSQRVVIWVVSGRPDYNGPDTKRLYRSLLEKGVRPWASEVTYRFSSNRSRDWRPRQFYRRSWERNPHLPLRGEAAARAGYVTR